MLLSYDLHIHSCLSPCADDDMLPSDVIGMAALKGLDIIAVTDHNSCKNCPAVIKLAGKYGITAIPGMELTTAEEVHILCLFESLDSAMRFDGFVTQRLPAFPNNEEIFGKQRIADENDEITGIIPNLLINAAAVGFDEVYDIVSEYNGIMIPAHIDKSSSSLLSNLGFIPPDSKFACAEVMNPEIAEKLKNENPYLRECRIITDSDAHSLGHISEPLNFLETAGRSTPDILYALTHPCK